MSIMNNGRSRRGFMASATCARVTIQFAEPVAVTTMSVDASSSIIASQGTAIPCTLAASAAARHAVRFVTPMWCTSWARRWVAVSSAISPAPTTSARRRSRRPKILRAREMAAKLTETAPSPSPVSARTRLPTLNAQWNSRLSAALVWPRSEATAYASLTWPRICGSPTTRESSPAATRKRCRVTAAPVIA